MDVGSSNPSQFSGSGTFIPAVPAIGGGGAGAVVVAPMTHVIVGNGGAAGCAGEMSGYWQLAETVAVAAPLALNAPSPCPGCGMAYLVAAANPLHPHNPAVCKAWKDGYEAGLAAARRETP